MQWLGLQECSGFFGPFVGSYVHVGFPPGALVSFQVMGIRIALNSPCECEWLFFLVLALR